jgi:hypothetical protein
LARTASLAVTVTGDNVAYQKNYILSAFQHRKVELGGSGIPGPPREAIGEHDDRRLTGKKNHLPFDTSTAEFGANLTGLHLPL